MERGSKKGGCLIFLMLEYKVDIATKNAKETSGIKLHEYQQKFTKFCESVPYFVRILHAVWS